MNDRGCKEYVEALEEERRKIRVFERELPLCLQLVTQTIEACKQQLSVGSADSDENLGSSEKTASDDGPVLEEFIPVKSVEELRDTDEEDQDLNDKKEKRQKGNGKKSEWLRSVQLWSQNPDPVSKESSPRETTVIGNGNGCAFHLLDKSTQPPPSTSSTAETNGAKRKDKQDKESQRKARRCWSPELHQRFLHALEQLGGSHSATPKQIRELMKEDGLSNDEVKSHLQKYRLHTRRPDSSTAAVVEPTPPPQFVVVGGIWVPPEFTSVGGTGTTTATAAVVEPSVPEIYAPVAKYPDPFRDAGRDGRTGSESNRKGCCSCSEGVESHTLGNSSSI